jgi:hypothetical protein
VNAVSPGVTPDTNLFSTSGSTPDQIKELHKRASDGNPLKEVPTPHDVAVAIAFLCSPNAATITGNTLPIDGGSSLTSNLYVEWEGIYHMDAKFAPKEVKTTTKVTKWVDEEIIEKVKPTVRDTAYFQKIHNQSHWATHLADAHIKVEDSYSKIKKEENALYNLEE